MKTFKARVHGTVILSEGPSLSFVDGELSFSRNRVLLTPQQIGKIHFTPYDMSPVSHNSKYTLSKEFNHKDVKTFTIEINGDKHFISINRWNRVKLNIIHERYFILREKEWVWKTVISLILGFAMGMIGFFLGINQNSQKAPSPSQVTTPK